MVELLNQIKVVAEARIIASDSTKRKQESYQEWQETNKELLDTASMDAVRVADEEAKLRELTVKAYNETGNKKPAPGVAIREISHMMYSLEAAFEWATEHKMALSLDRKAFEGIAKSTQIDFVKVVTEAQGTISQDLSQVLAEETKV